jgi:hypothetical protein
MLIVYPLHMINMKMNESIYIVIPQGASVENDIPDEIH